MSDLRTTRGRPRDPERELAILRATLDLVAETGYDAVTVEAVARRAGASKATIYRRWASKRELVAAAAAGLVPTSHDEVDTGSLRGDLLALCTRLRDTMAGVEAQAVLGLLRGGLHDLDLGDAMERLAGQTGARLPATVIRRAVDRGELPSDVDPFAFEEVAGAAIVLRRLTERDCSDGYLADLVDQVLLPALRSAPLATDHPRAGLFSGRPDS